MFCSTWVMMDQDTRRLSKMPQEVLAEISPYFLDQKCIQSEGCQKIKKLNDNAPYVRSDLVVNTRIFSCRDLLFILLQLCETSLIGVKTKSERLHFPEEMCFLSS